MFGQILDALARLITWYYYTVFVEIFGAGLWRIGSRVRRDFLDVMESLPRMGRRR